MHEVDDDDLVLAWRDGREEETVAAPPLPPFFPRRPRGRWVVIEERHDRPLPSGDGSY